METVQNVPDTVTAVNEATWALRGDPALAAVHWCRRAAWRLRTQSGPFRCDCAFEARVGGLVRFLPEQVHFGVCLWKSMKLHFGNIVPVLMEYFT